VLKYPKVNFINGVQSLIKRSALVSPRIVAVSRERYCNRGENESDSKIEAESIHRKTSYDRENLLGTPLVSDVTSRHIDDQHYTTTLITDYADTKSPRGADP
jgi:hypothetical protein